MSVTTGHRLADTSFASGLDHYGYQYSNGPRPNENHRSSPGMPYLNGAQQPVLVHPLPSRLQPAYSEAVPQLNDSWRRRGPQCPTQPHAHSDHVQRALQAKAEASRLHQEPSYMNGRTGYRNSGERRSNQVCLNFQRGACAFGDACVRIHTALPPSPQASKRSAREPLGFAHNYSHNLPPNSASTASPVPQSICEEYRRTGVCGKYGTCGNNHIPPAQPLTLPVLNDANNIASYQSQHATNDLFPTYPGHSSSSYINQSVVITAPAPPFQQLNVAPSEPFQNNAQYAPRVSFTYAQPHPNQSDVAPALSHDHTPAALHVSVPECHTLSTSPFPPRNVSLVNNTPNRIVPHSQQQALLAMLAPTKMSQQSILQSVAPLIKLRNTTRPPNAHTDALPNKSVCPVKPTPSGDTHASISKPSAIIAPAKSDDSIPSPEEARPVQEKSLPAEQKSHSAVDVKISQPLVKFPLPQTPSLVPVSRDAVGEMKTTSIDVEPTIQPEPVVREQPTVKLAPVVSTKSHDFPAGTSSTQDKPSVAAVALRPPLEATSPAPMVEKSQTTSKVPKKSERVTSPAQVITASGTQSQTTAKVQANSVTLTDKQSPVPARTQVICNNYLQGKCRLASCPGIHPADSRPDLPDEVKASTDSITSLQKESAPAVLSTPTKDSSLIRKTSVGTETVSSKSPVDQSSTFPAQSAEKPALSKRRILTDKQLDKICRKHLHGQCYYGYSCYRQHVERNKWHEYYNREDICPDGPEKCSLKYCQFKTATKNQKTALAVAAPPPPSDDVTVPEAAPAAPTTNTTNVASEDSVPVADVVAKPTHNNKKLGKTESLESVSSKLSAKGRPSSYRKNRSAVTVSGSIKATVASSASSEDTHAPVKSTSPLQSSSTLVETVTQKSILESNSSIQKTTSKKTTGSKTTSSLESVGDESLRPRQKQSSPQIDRLVGQLKASATKEASDDGKSTIVADETVPSLPPGLNVTKKSMPILLQPARQTTLTVFDATRVTFGPGFEVQDLMTGFETRDIIIKGVPVSASIDAIKEILQPFGDVVNVNLPDHKKDSTMIVKASFVTHMAAAAAVSALDRTSTLGGSMDVMLASTSPGKAVVHDGDVCLEFPSPSRFAFAGYSDRATADAAIAMAAHSAMFGEIHEGLPNLGPVNVRFQGLDPNALPAEIENLGKCEGVMLGSYNYRRLEPALEQLYDKLESFGDLDSLDVLPPPYTRGIVRAWARFSNPKTAELVCSELNFRPQRFIGNAILSAHHQRTLMYTLPGNIFDVLSFDIRYLRDCASTDDNRCNVVILDKRRFSTVTVVQVKLVAENLVVLGRLKTSFERLLKGSEVKRAGSIIWDPYFVTSGGLGFLNGLQRMYRGIVINRNLRRRILSIFGPPGRTEAVRRAIVEKVEELRRRPYKTFSLKSQVVGLFMSSDLAKLQQELGADNIELNLSQKTLKVHGNEDAFKVVRLAIVSAQRRQPGQKRSIENACPVCLDEVTSPVTLECGHTWCKSCISQYLTAAVDTKAFPITCLGDEARCKHRITLELAEEILSPSQVESIVQASFISYLHAHASEFHHCPTPDCPQIYRNAPRGTILRCPSCLIRICTDCDKVQHTGTCRYSDSEDMKMFEEWTKDHDVKKCPGCKAPIERSAGCNHMTCVRCKSHICWVCLARFPSGDEVYDHMHETHGGIGL